METPTPDPVEQEERLNWCIADAERILREAVAEHFANHRLAARVVLFSGGNDSSTLVHLMTEVIAPDLRATHAAHANTTIGVERTRDFVRDTCERIGLPLVEEKPPVCYDDLVAEQGFPGPAMHFKMYQRLKERALRKVRARFVHDPRRERVLFVAGRRRNESERRAGIPEHERPDGSIVWASPFANWTNDDLAAYREAYNVQKNPVADELGMSGECLCGAFAEPGEFERIAEVDPEVAQQIVDLEQRAREAGVPEQKCRWGWGAYRADPDGQPVKTGPLCSSCTARRDPLLDLQAARDAAATA